MNLRQTWLCCGGDGDDLKYQELHSSEVVRPSWKSIPFRLHPGLGNSQSK